MWEGEGRGEEGQDSRARQEGEPAFDLTRYRHSLHWLPGTLITSEMPDQGVSLITSFSKENVIHDYQKLTCLINTTDW